MLHFTVTRGGMNNFGNYNLDVSLGMHKKISRIVGTFESEKLTSGFVFHLSGSW